jgi:hypothetical protein
VSHLSPWKVVDGKEDLQMWRIAAKVLNKQSLAANYGGSPALGCVVYIATLL